MSAAEGVEQMQAAMKKAAAALREADIPHMLGGGFASWAHGGPETFHDVDFMIKPEDAERTLMAMEAAGMRTERPPEEWLIKAYDGDCLIDLIYEPSGLKIDDEVFERSQRMSVLAIGVNVMSLEDVLLTKLASLREHELDYSSVVEISRSLREKIDWDDLRRRTPDTPYARAFFVLVDELGLIPDSPPASARDSAIKRSSDTPEEKSA